MILNLFKKSNNNDKFILFGYQIEFDSIKSIKKYVRKNKIKSKRIKILYYGGNAQNTKLLVYSKYMRKFLGYYKSYITFDLYKISHLNQYRGAIYYSNDTEVISNNIICVIDSLPEDNNTHIIECYNPNTLEYNNDNFDGSMLDAFNSFSKYAKFRSFITNNKRNIYMESYYIGNKEFIADYNFIYGKTPFSLDDQIIYTNYPDKNFLISFLRTGNLKEYNRDSILNAKYSNGDCFLHYELLLNGRSFNEVVPSALFRKV